jgi:hypothetical protein
VEDERDEERIIKRKMPLCNEEEDDVHIILEFRETRKLRERLLKRKWLKIN